MLSLLIGLFLPCVWSNGGFNQSETTTYIHATQRDTRYRALIRRLCKPTAQAIIIVVVIIISPFSGLNSIMKNSENLKIQDGGR